MRRLPQNYTLAIIVVLIITAVAAALIFGGSDKQPKSAAKTASAVLPCGPYRSDKKVLINRQTISAEIPSSSAAQQKGLSGRPCIPQNQGMLFVFAKPGQYFFWMKDMRFPIDILWIGPDNAVVGQEIDVEPSTYPDRFVNKKENPAQYVLEIKSNRSRELKVSLGTSVSF